MLALFRLAAQTKHIPLHPERSFNHTPRNSGEANILHYECSEGVHPDRTLDAADSLAH